MLTHLFELNHGIKFHFTIILSLFGSECIFLLILIDNYFVTFMKNQGIEIILTLLLILHLFCHATTDKHVGFIA